MKIYILILIGIFCVFSCTTIEKKHSEQQESPMIGTWKLISGTIVKGSDTVFTDYTVDQEMIKIINKTHFSFLRHDLKNGENDAALFVAGGGRYTLKGNKYTEYLDYFINRQWEGNKFEFEYEIRGDTLITNGIERIEDLNIDQINIEKYIRVND